MLELYTDFAPAERAQESDLQRQIALFSSESPLAGLIEIVPDLVFIINKHRQIVYCNRSAEALTGKHRRSSAYGKRPGELLDCTHSCETEGGCGTTRYCSTCGAVKAILTSLNRKEDVEECRVLQRGSGLALDIRVRTTPLTVGNEDFVIFCASDISDEKRRYALERIFFHDVMNTVSGIRGITELLLESTAEKMQKFVQDLGMLSDILADEINAQRMLSAAESSDLHPAMGIVSSSELIESTVLTYRHHPHAGHARISAAPDSASVVFSSDRIILLRVLGNLVKNACEASSRGDTVTIGCNEQDHGLDFFVHNPGVIPPAVQLQLFQRSFSTKGKDRGLGTYSIKLLTEQYLKGTVDFRSTAGEGTTFFVRLPLLP